jgi:tetratricopeptide (TPR) repeat protein
VLFWVGWFVVAQLPTANWLEQEAAFAERYVFLAWLAGPALLAGLASAVWDRPRARRALVAAGVAACGLAAVTSVGRAAWFRDDATFALQWLHTNPRSPDAHHLYGVHLLLSGRPAEAVEHLEAARRWAEPSPDIHVNLAIALARSGRRAEAIHELEAALRLAPDHPEARHNLERLRRGGPGGG